MSSNSLIFFREFHGDIRARSLTFRGLSESQNIPRIILRKGGKARNRELFCVKAGFSMVKSMENLYFSHTFPQDNSRKVELFPAYHIAEKHAFLQDNPWKGKTFPELSGGKFRKVKISFFKGLSLLL